MASPQAAAPIRVLIADSQAVIRAGLTMALEEQPEMTVVAEASSLEAALVAVRASQPDVAVVDLELAGSSPLETARSMSSLPGLATVFLTGTDDPAAPAAALSAGARAVLSKSAPLTKLMDAIRSASSGRPWNPPSIETRLEPVADDWDALTARERDVAGLVAQGLPYREVATRLGISEHTVKNHLRRIYDKLDISSRVELAVHGADAARRC